MLTVAILSVLGGLVGLAFGADLLVRGAGSLALRMGISALVVGLTVVAFGTSTPELIVSVNAALRGQPDIAMGNVVGSNIFNIAVILGLASLLYPIHCNRQVIVRELPALLGVSLLLPLLVIASWGLGGVPEGASGMLSRPEGIALICLVIAYTYLAYRSSGKGGRALEAAVEEELEEGVLPIGPAEEAKHRPIWLDVTYMLIGLALLYGGGELLVSGAVKIAQIAGLSELVIGLTVVAAGTGMPELATSVIAAIRKQPDISLGNVIGSNVFNILLILGVTAVVSPIPVSQDVLWRDIPVMLFFTLLCVPIMMTGGRISRLEGSLLLALYVAYTAYLVISASPPS